MEKFFLKKITQNREQTIIIIMMMILGGRREKIMKILFLRQKGRSISTKKSLETFMKRVKRKHKHLISHKHSYILSTHSHALIIIKIILMLGVLCFVIYHVCACVCV